MCLVVSPIADAARSKGGGRDFGPLNFFIEGCREEGGNGFGQISRVVHLPQACICGFQPLNIAVNNRMQECYARHIHL